MNEFVIDAFEFCRRRERRSGDVPVSELPRLADETENKAGSIHWVLESGADTLGRPMLLLSVSGSVELMCQRCLSPLTFDIASMASLILAKDETSADEIDAALGEDDTFDVIVGSTALNVTDLIEDEALLAIPFSSKHEVCPDQQNQMEIQGARKVSPFDVLKNLK
ncbi:MAG: YceD family protein [Burkholderiaceae bacterium]